MANKRSGFIREIIAMLAILVFCIGGTAYWFLLPRAETWHENLQRSRLIETNRAQALDLVGMDNRVQTIKARAREIIKRNAAAGDSMQYYDAIQRCGKMVGLTLGRVSPGSTNPSRSSPTDSGVERLEFHISTTGSYAQLVEFLETLRALPVFHRINGFRITPRTGAEQTHLVVAEIDLQFAKFVIDPSLLEAIQNEVSP